MANLECLRDYIGIDWCGATAAPPSGLYVNSLPGISFKGLSAIGKEEQQTFAGTWSDIQTRAMKRFEHDLRQKFSKRIRLKSLVQSSNLGWKINDTALTLPITEYVGFNVDLGCNPDDDYMESAYYEISLQDLYLWSVTAQTDIVATVKIFEVDTEVAIYCQTTTIDLLPNAWNKIPVNFNFIRDRQQSDFEIINNSEKYLVTVGFSAEVSTFRVPLITDDFCECCDYRIRPGYMDAPAQSDCSLSRIPAGGVTNETTLRGITAIIGSRCSLDRMVCSNKDVFAQAWWYLLGVETMNEQMYSERFNRYTTIDRKKAGELRQYYEIMYGGGKVDEIFYEGALTQAVDGIEVDCSDCCVECSASPALVEVLP